MEDVESSIQSQKQNIVRCDILNIFQFVYHEKLRQNG